MKLYKLLFLMLFLAGSLKAQIIVSPYVVLIDDKSKAGTYLVSNQTDETQEVTVFFKFGYPVAAENGDITMMYSDSLAPNDNDLTNMINAFPKKFSLKPGAKQTIRMSVKPIPGLKEGTYWTRIFTSSQSKQTIKDTSSSLSASIDFVLNQVTTVLYRNKRFKNTLVFKDAAVSIDTSSVNFFTDIEVQGDSPFFTGSSIKIFDESNNLVKENQEFYTTYYKMNKRTSIPLSELKPGKYTAEITITSDANSDIPKSDEPLKEPQVKKVEFIIN